MTFVPAVIMVEGAGMPIEFQFIPEQLAIQRSNRWARQNAQGQTLPNLGFQQAMPATLNMTLWFDATQVASDVAGNCQKLLDLLKPKDELKNGFSKGLPSAPAIAGGGASQSPQHRPPTLTFQWGATLSFVCVLTSCNVTYKLFDDSGRPLRATAACTFQQVAEDDQFGLQNPTSGGRTGERIHRLAPRETLEYVAYAAFGKTSLWRALASFNGIDDPLRVKAGDAILLPPSADDLAEWA